ncbi:MAG TPA: heavy metal translocating P-type ATPase [Acholeplasmataceae bacterium]|nr:heavy metal translocating P-type ATPase [Acholeplasmataceae bacterium]
MTNKHTSSGSSDHKHNNHFAIISYFIGLIAFIVALFINDDIIQASLFIFATIISGYHIIIEGFISTVKNTRKARRFKPNTHLLMTLAAIGAIIIGEYREGALLILIFAGAHFLEDYAENKSKKEISNLINLNPTKARLINLDGSIKEISISELKIGDQLLVLNGDQIPTDGLIIKGYGIIDEAAITGESIPVEKTIGDTVFGSTINSNSNFEMEVTKNSDETVYAKIIELVNQSQINISKTAKLIKKIEPVYVTITLVLTPIFYLLGLLLFKWGQYDSFYRTMVFLIAASPCALAATDIPATLSAISNLARKGVLFKGGSYLSNLADLKVVAFDKTGTLTNGYPKVTDLYIREDIKEADIDLYLSLILSMEQKANHPLAEAIITYLNKQKTLNLEIENIIGVGIETIYENVKYRIGKPSSFNNIDEIILNKTISLEELGKTVVYFGTDNEVILLIALIDLPKESSVDAIKYLKKQDIHTIMLTGDSKSTGKAVAEMLGIDEVKANILPEDKSIIINDLKNNYGVTAMLGDGINDAPALVAADIGFAMGKGSDIAIDVADAVLVKNDLSRFTYTHKLAKKLRRIVIQNIIFAMTVVLFLIVMNILGLMKMSFAVVIHEGSTMIVILNGLRLLKIIK